MILQRLPMDEPAIGVVPEPDAFLTANPAQEHLATLSHVRKIHQTLGDIPDYDSLTGDFIHQATNLPTHSLQLVLQFPDLVVLLEGAVLSLPFPLNSGQSFSRSLQSLQDGIRLVKYAL